METHLVNPFSVGAGPVPPLCLEQIKLFEACLELVFESEKNEKALTLQNVGVTEMS